MIEQRLLEIVHSLVKKKESSLSEIICNEGRFDIVNDFTFVKAWDCI